MDLNSIKESIKYGVCNALGFAVASPFLALSVAAAPVVGLTAVPVLGIQAIFHAISKNFHFRNSKNENGMALSKDLDPETNLPRYMDMKYKFTAKDLTNLEHERDRLKAKINLEKKVDSIKEYAKLLIPVIGLCWFWISRNSNEDLISGLPHKAPLYKDLSAIEHHIRSVTPSNAHINFNKNLNCNIL